MQATANQKSQRAHLQTGEAHLCKYALRGDFSQGWHSPATKKTAIRYPSQGRIEKAERDPLSATSANVFHKRWMPGGIHFRKKSSCSNVLDTEPPLPADSPRRLFCSSSVPSKLQELKLARKWQLAAISCESSCTKFQTKP